MEKLSDRDYKAERRATLELQVRNNKKLAEAKNKKPVIKDLSKKLIQTNFLSKQDKQYSAKHNQTLQSTMDISSKRDNSQAI